jgi:hypothetical protein
LVSALLLVSACGHASGSIATDQLRPLRTSNDVESIGEDDSLEARMVSVREQMENAGLQRGGIWQRGFIPSGSRETLRLEIAADACLTIVAFASAGVRDVDAALYLPDGTLVAQDNQPDSHPTLQVCADGVGRAFYYSLHAYEGAGAYLVASFMGERSLFAAAAAVVGGRPGVAGEVELSADERVVQAFSENVKRRGFEPTKPPVHLLLAASQSVRVAVPVAVAHCYTVAAFAIEGVEDVNVRVIDENGHDVAFDSTASRDSATQFCTDRDAQFSAELVAAQGQGAVVVAVYAVAQVELGGDGGLWLGERSSELLSRRPLSETLHADATAAVEAGYTVPAVHARGRLVIGEAVEHAITLKPASCTRIAVNGGEGAGVLRLELAELAADLAPTVSRHGDSQLDVCTPTAREVRAIVISRRGYGDYAVSTATKAIAAAHGSLTPHD